MPLVKELVLEQDEVMLKSCHRFFDLGDPTGGFMKASDLFIRALENEGVEYIFGIPGEENLDLLESLRKSTELLKKSMEKEIYRIPKKMCEFLKAC